MRVINRPDVLKDLREIFHNQNIEIVNIKVEKIGERTIGIDILAKFPHNYHPDEVMMMLIIGLCNFNRTVELIGANKDRFFYQ